MCVIVKVEEREKRERERESAVFTLLKTCLLSDGRRMDIPKLFVLHNERPQPLKGLLILKPALRKCIAQQTSAGTLWNKDLIKTHSSQQDSAMVTRGRAPEMTLYLTIHNRIVAIDLADGPN